MNRIKAIASEFSERFGSRVFAWARIFSSWETDEVYTAFRDAKLSCFITRF